MDKHSYPEDVFTSLSGVTAGERWAELLLRAHPCNVNLTCLSLLTLELCLDTQLLAQLSTLFFFHSRNLAPSLVKNTNSSLAKLKDSWLAITFRQSESSRSLKCCIISGMWLQVAVATSVSCLSPYGWDMNQGQQAVFNIKCINHVSVKHCRCCRLLVTQSRVNRLYKSSPKFCRPHGGWMHNNMHPVSSPCTLRLLFCTVSCNITCLLCVPSSRTWAAGWQQGSLNNLRAYAGVVSVRISCSLLADIYNIRNSYIFFLFFFACEYCFQAIWSLRKSQ